MSNKKKKREEKSMVISGLVPHGEYSNQGILKGEVSLYS